MKAAAVALLLFMATSALAQSPVPGDAVTQLPSSAVPIDHRGARYYFSEGLWLQQVVAGFVVVSPPAGIVVPQLPPSATALQVDGVPYYRANDVYYAAAPGGYKVVPPPGGLFYCASMRAYYPYVPECPEGWSVFSTVPPQLR